jgi:hypothetical protein
MVFQTNDPFFPANAQFTRFFNKPGTIVADKTHFIPLLEEQAFQYMFLRPRRWGKSTFLNMLAAYYDVATKDSFEQLFGQLFIGKAPTKSRNSHLVLLFDFSTIVSTGSFDDIRSSFFNNVAQSLCQFLFKYQDILGSAPPEEYIVVNDIAVSLGNVLVSKFRVTYHHGTEHNNRTLFNRVAIALSLALMNTIAQPTLV